MWRALDAPVKWELLTPNPIPCQNFRDATKLQTVRFLVPPEAFVDNGSFGQRCIKLPDIPYSEVVKGRPTVANSPDAITVEIENTDKTIAHYRPKQVSGIDQLVWLEVGQSLPYGGAVNDFPIIDFDNVASITIIYRKLVNYVDIMTNLQRAYYVVIPVGDRGEEHGPAHPDAKVVNNLEVDDIDYIFKRMVHMNAWIFEQTGEPAHLLFRRTAGERCGCSLGQDFTLGRTGCPDCFETGIIGGYYGPFDFLFQDPDTALTRTLDEGGTKVERRSRSYLGRTPIVQDGDMIVRLNGERLVISGVSYMMPRGVLLQQEFDVSLLPPKDTRYNIPLFEPENPPIFNPASQRDPGHGAVPVFQTDTMPHKDLEYPTRPVGKSVTFGNIQA